MKRATQILMMVVLMASACTKDPVPQIPPPANNPISRITMDDNIVDTRYNSDGSIHAFTLSGPGRTNLVDFVFSYENGRLKEVVYGGKWKYYYTGNLISSVETYNEYGTLRYVTRFGYTNEKITEKLEWIVTAISELPSRKTKFSYNADGNISKKELYQFINGDWKKSEEIIPVKYDQKVNTREHLENYPYLPLSYFSVNNVLRENYFDDYGQPDGVAVHEYTYDIAGRPVSRKTTFSFIGFPDTYSIASFHY